MIVQAKADAAQMPGRVLQTTAAGVVLVVSLPVITFAISTTLFALTLLSVRASILSLHFWSSVIAESWTRSNTKAPRLPARPAPPAPLNTQTTLEFRSMAQHSRRNSFTDGSSIKRLSYRSDSNLSLAGTPINRDFEGVGGWLSPRNAEEDSQSLWTNMNSRLERTRSASRHHKRSHTSGSLQHSTLNSPDLLPMAPARTPRPRPHTSGSASPQSYFSIQLPTSRSMVSLPRKRLSALSMEKLARGKNERTESLEAEVDDSDRIGIAI